MEDRSNAMLLRRRIICIGGPRYAHCRPDSFATLQLYSLPLTNGITYSQFPPNFLFDISIFPYKWTNLRKIRLVWQAEHQYQDREWNTWINKSKYLVKTPNIFNSFFSFVWRFSLFHHIWSVAKPCRSGLNMLRFGGFLAIFSGVFYWESSENIHRILEIIVISCKIFILWAS